jgi:casein kinase II subunit alpha
VLGTDALHRWVDKYGLTISQTLLAMIGRHAPKPFQRFITRECMHLCTSEGLDFLDGLLRYDPAERLTAQEAMAHPYFAPIREQQASGASSSSSVAVASTTASVNSSGEPPVAAAAAVGQEHPQE